jgi:DNA-binding NarL/FixJ family response regulator
LGSERHHCLVIDGHPLVRLGVREALGDEFQVHESANRTEGLDLIRDVGSIDVAIVDMRPYPAGDNGSEPTGREAIRVLHQADPGLGIVAHGELPERHFANAALQAGATAYVARTARPGDLRRAVQAAIEQERFVDPAIPPKGSRAQITGRQRQILQLLADGGSTTAAARDLGLSEETVKTHTKNALGRLSARNRTHAVAIALRESLIE